MVSQADMTDKHKAGRHGRLSFDPSEWRRWPFVKIDVFGLPLDVTTYEIYENFRLYGDLDLIAIKSDWKNPDQFKKAELRFKRSPRDNFWRLSPLRFQRKKKIDGGTEPPCLVRVRLASSQKTDFAAKKQSQTGIPYPMEIDITGISLEFGIVMKPKHFMSMRKLPARTQHPVKLALHIDRNEIEIKFPCMFSSDTGTRFREYRFLVSLDSSLSITESGETESLISLILNLTIPPPFSKKLGSESHMHHDDESRKWQEDDMWSRQTDLALTKTQVFDIRKLPVSLRASHLSHVNLGRWKTYRLMFAKTDSNISAYRIFKAACSDRNVPIHLEYDYRDLAQTDSMWQELKHWEEPGPDVPEFERQFHTKELSFPVRYWLDVCISHGILNEYSLNGEFFDELYKLEEREAVKLLENLFVTKVPCYNPNEIFKLYRLRRPVKPLRIQDNYILMNSATITATTMRVNPPTVEVSNRIFRQYHNHADRFLRVRFEDDEYRGCTRIYATTTSKMSELFVRVKRAMLKGIEIGGRHYEFLAWGNSQLRDHGAFFFAPLPGVLNASKIVAVAGEFDHETIIAKRAARLGQCFSTTKSLSGRIERITKHDLFDDIERNGYNFSDGCGKISPLLAAQIALQFKMSSEAPSVYQFRLGGCKGVLAIAPELKGRTLQIRKSQFKFASDSEALEVIRHSEFWSAYLNRQLILVLSALDIPTRTFLQMQQQEIDALERAMQDDSAALEALYDRVDPNRATPFLAELVRDGFREAQEPFVTSMLHLWRAWSLKYLKEKAHIRVSKGALLLGCVDETATLKGFFNQKPAPYSTLEEKEKALPEVFVQITDPRTGSKQVVTGKCIIARNPSLHMGDIRVCRAVDVPQLHHLRDCIVLPSTGDRDLSSACSGGDLDGDDYVISWDQSLIPPSTKWFLEPFDYTPPPPVRATKAVTQNDFINFFHQYMKNDFLGRIATAHLIWADCEGIDSEECLELTKLHSMAVDYPKTGVPAKMPAKLLPLERPHFLDPKGKKTCRSRKVLGVLYDNVQKVKFTPRYNDRPDSRILNGPQPSQKHLRIAAELKESYDESMRRIMTQHEIQTEFEVFSTFCLHHSKAVKDFKFHEEIGLLSKALRDTTFESIVEEMGGRDHESLAPFAVAAYQLVYSQLEEAKKQALAEDKDVTPDNMPFISFPWVLHETLGKIARESCGIAECSPDFFNSSGQTQSSDLADATKISESLPNTIANFNPWFKQTWTGHEDPFKQSRTTSTHNCNGVASSFSGSGNLPDCASRANSVPTSNLSKDDQHEVNGDAKNSSNAGALANPMPPQPTKPFVLGRQGSSASIAQLRDRAATDESLDQLCHSQIVPHRESGSSGTDSFGSDAETASFRDSDEE